MSNTKLIIEERAADIGNFMVGGLQPFRKKRMVGPVIFIDHVGPVNLKPNENMDVDRLRVSFQSYQTKQLKSLCQLLG